MAVIHDVLLSILKLHSVLAKKNSTQNQRGKVKQHKVKSNKTHILPNNRPQRRNPQNPHATNLIHEESLAGEHRLPQALPLVLPDHALGAREEGLPAHGPLLVAAEADVRDVAERGRGEEQLPGPREGGVRHLAAEELLHGELEVALDHDRGGHGEHGAWGEVSIGIVMYLRCISPSPLSLSFSGERFESGLFHFTHLASPSADIPPPTEP